MDFRIAVSCQFEMLTYVLFGTQQTDLGTRRKVATFCGVLATL
jgi:hypothetical protein